VTSPHGVSVSGTHEAEEPFATQCVPAAQRTVAHASSTGSQLAVSPDTTHCVPVGHKIAAHGFGASSGTQPQTFGELSKCDPTTHSAFATH
jgi:hypothetical protein